MRVKFLNYKTGIMTGGEAISCRGLSEKLDILPVPLQYIFLSHVICNNQNNFYMGLDVHRLNTRNKNQLHIPTTHLSTFQKGVTYSGIRIFNRLPSNIQHLRNEGVCFKNKLRKYPVINLFYSTAEL